MEALVQADLYYRHAQGKRRTADKDGILGQPYAGGSIFQRGMEAIMRRWGFREIMQGRA